jgi:hypothetical protein
MCTCGQFCARMQALDLNKANGRHLQSGLSTEAGVTLPPTTGCASVVRPPGAVMGTAPPASRMLKDPQAGTTVGSLESVRCASCCTAVALTLPGSGQDL